MPSPWTNAVEDVRRNLHDGPTDKYRSRKDVVGSPDGENLTFKTFETRRVTDFTAPDDSTGVYVDGVAVDVSSDDPISGEFVLAAAPDEGQRIQASYYVKWFSDEDLISFLISASNWLGFSDTYANIPNGLQASAREYSAFMAYQSLASASSENLSETYRMEDSPNPNRQSPMEQYIKIAKIKYDMAVQMRDDYYKRGGRREGPSSSNISGAFTTVNPNR